MRVLVTGASGFVGRHLLILLLKRGFSVFGTDLNEVDCIEGVNFIKSDVTNKEELSNVIKKSKPEWIFHLAGLSSIQKCEENPGLANKISVDGTKNLLDSCIDNDINPKIMVTSSAHVYGIPVYIPLDESHSTNPVTQYGISKLNQEKIALNYFKEKKSNIIISRSFNHIGPGQSVGFVTSDFAKQIAEIEKGLIRPEIIVGDLSPQRDFTDVRDVINAYVLLIEKGKPGEIYNIGSGKSYSIKEILNKLLSKSTKQIKILNDKNKFKKSDVPIFVANNRKFVELTGWKRQFTIDVSLKDILDYWRSIV